MESYGLWRGSWDTSNNYGHWVCPNMASKNLKQIRCESVNENMVIIYMLVVLVSLGILIVGPISNQWMVVFLGILELIGYVTNNWKIKHVQ